MISMVTDDKALAEVVNEGVVPGLPKGAIHVAMGTHSVAALREIGPIARQGGPDPRRRARAGPPGGGGGKARSASSRQGRRTRSRKLAPVLSN